MKQKLGSEEQPDARSKLVFAAVAVAMVVVLAVYGIQNIRSQVSELQLQLDLKSDELALVSSQLTEERQALETKSGELELAQSEIFSKNNELEQANNELDAAGIALADAMSQQADTIRQLNETTSELESARSELAATKDELEQLHIDLQKAGLALTDAIAQRAVALRQLNETTGALESAQSALAQVRDELETAQSELAETNDALTEAESELPRLSYELETSQNQLLTLQDELAARDVDLEVASIVVAESHIEFYAFNWAYQIAACIVKETRSLADFWLGEGDRFSPVQAARYADYQEHLTDQSRVGSPLREHCMEHGRDIDLLANRWWDRAFSRMASEAGLNANEASEVSKRYGGILVPHETIMKYVDEILSEFETNVGDWPPAMTIPSIRRLWFGRV